MPLYAVLYVPSHSEFYKDIDLLTSWGCGRPALSSFRPLDHEYLVSRLNRDTEEKECGAPEWLMQKANVLGARLPGEAKSLLVFSYQNVIPLLGLDAEVSPQFADREGRSVVDGANLYLELQLHTAIQKKWTIGLSATPGWLVNFQDYQNLYGKFYLQEGYLKLGYERLGLSWGRMALRFGESVHGNLLFSDATKPVDQVQLFIKPSVSGASDPFSQLTLGAMLGFGKENAFRSSSRFLSVWAGTRLFDLFEISWMEILQFSGSGAPSIETSDLVRSLLGASDDDLITRRQKAMAFSFSLWEPGYRAKFYHQVYIDGYDSSIPSFLVGLWFPHLGPIELRAEYVKTADKAYQNPIWRQGLTYDKSPLGSPLGSDGEGVYLDLGIPDFYQIFPEITLSYESRSGTLSTRDFTAEKRYGLGGRIGIPWGKTQLTLGSQYTMIDNAYLVRGQSAYSFLFLTQLSYPL